MSDDIRKIGVIGAGQMGSGIAHVASAVALGNGSLTLAAVVVVAEARVHPAETHLGVAVAGVGALHDAGVGEQRRVQGTTVVQGTHVAVAGVDEASDVLVTRRSA